MYAITMMMMFFLSGSSCNVQWDKRRINYSVIYGQWLNVLVAYFIFIFYVVFFQVIRLLYHRLLVPSCLLVYFTSVKNANYIYVQQEQTSAKIVRVRPKSVLFVVVKYYIKE